MELSSCQGLSTKTSNKLIMQFQFPIQIYYEDTDAGGVVYYANYLKFMERSRTEWLRSLGFEQDVLMREEGVLFAVKHAEADYVRPARFNDKLLVGSKLASMGRVNLVIEHQIENAADGMLLCKGMVKIVCLGVDDFRPRPIPQPIINVMEQITNAE